MDGETPAAEASRTAQEDFLSTVGSPPTITIPVMYDTDGGWRIGDLTDAEWTNLTGMDFFDGLRMRPQVIADLMKAGVDQISLATDAQGIHIRVNGNDLPYIGWQDGELNHVLELASQMGAWEALANNGMNPEEIVGVVEGLLPISPSIRDKHQCPLPQGGGNGAVTAGAPVHAMHLKIDVSFILTSISFLLLIVPWLSYCVHTSAAP